MIKSGLLFALIVGLAISLPAAAKLYKWVDNQGVTHYGETIPPEYADKDRAELNNAGRVVKKETALTPEDRRNKKQADAKKLEAEKAALEQQRHDQTLTSTYSNVNEIELARSRSLQQVDARINSVNSQHKMANDNLLGLQNEADGYTKANKNIPASLQEDLQEAQERLGRVQQTMEKLNAERITVDARYDADKARYQQLTGK